ncbi:MAG: glycosyltransferase family 39 protein [Nitrososphaerota archaeon]|nr:glycosyltransferase family 39 protein [Nitrososphaerota archaeon]MDG7023161.1 glycosyltransferase family 39 protein [Nitrososphaerota archaeon]
MQVGGAGPANNSLRRPLRVLVALSFTDLAAFLAVMYVHTLSSDGALVAPADALGAALGVLAAASLLTGVAHAWLAFPGHRRAVAFIVAITLATLLAHAFIINDPAATAHGILTGQVGSSFNDNQITVGSSAAGANLSLNLEVSGGNAIAQADVSAGGVPLPGGWSTSPPSHSSPLEPGTSATGVWRLPTSNTTEVTISYQYLTCYDTGKRDYGCIMDEVFYVPEGMGILAGQHCSTGNGAPSDCHLEHPPLVPALLAAGMAAFGEYDAAGWRVMPALLGTFSIPLLFGIAWKVSGDKKVAYLSATFLALDVMFFSQSSGGLLDIPEVFFGLAAFFVYFANLRIWKLDRHVLAGVLIGVSALAKETALFFALAFATYVFFFEGGNYRERMKTVAKVSIVVVLVFSVGLEAYDYALVSPSAAGTTYCAMNGNTFVQQVGYILCYGSGLTAHYLECQGGPHSVGYWCKYPNDPGGPPILPTDWLTYYSPITYFAVTVCPESVNGVCQGGSYQEIAYYGVTNFLETWTVYIWVPLAAYALYRWLKRGKGVPEAQGSEPAAQQAATPAEPQGMPGDVRFAGLALILFLWSYVPYLFLLLAERVTYPFYFVPGIPAVALGAAYWTSRSWFPKWLLYVYVAMVFVFFLIYFPDKAFLPVAVRSLLGH